MMTPRDSERGAIAVTVVVLMTALIVVAAAATDLGYAYAVKRKLSVSVDAAALAAAAAVSNALPPGSASCDGAALQPTAAATAKSYMKQNDPNSSVTVTVPDPECVASSDGTGFSSVKVTVNASEDTPSFFGGIAGIGGYHPARSATAQFFVPQTLAGGLRPIAACAPSSSEGYTGAFVVYVSKDLGICGTVSEGNWGVLNFFDQGQYGTFNEVGTQAYYPSDPCASKNATSGGSAKCQKEWISNGYMGPVTFPNRCNLDSTTPSGKNTCIPSAAYLPNTAPGPGLADSTGFANSSDFAGLLGKTILLPVADTYDSAAKTMDIVGVVTVEVCGIKLQKQLPPLQVTDPTLGCPSPDTMPANDYANWVSDSPTMANTVMLWLLPTDFTVSGTVNGPGSCDLLDTKCDFGTRAVRLYQ